MGLDSELTVILREFVHFLESLRNVKLPQPLDTARDNLLERSTATLANFESRASSRSPEPYLNMKPGKGILIMKRKSEELVEYIGAEENKPGQDYYEMFPEVREARNSGSLDDEANSYAQFSVSLTKTRSRKCGPLHKKERFLLFEPLRSCWCGLVGSHLLIYGSEKDARPVTVVSIQGYKSRHAPNVVSRNQKRSESAFEIFRPGYETLQFVAKTPEEMELWISAICQLDEGEKKREDDRLLEQLQLELKRNYANEGYEDDGTLKTDENDVCAQVQNNNETEQEKEKSVEAPPLPSRVTRKLPKLPEEDSAPSYEQMEVYDEDDIYHKIEDLRAENYQNCVVGKTKNVEPGENYDDVEAVTENLHARKEKTEQSETYDDIKSVASRVQDDEINAVAYDVKAPEEKIVKKTKQQHKKSFLDRMRRKRLTVKKEEKISQSSNSLEICEPEVQSEYNYPPPPKPIYVKPPTLRQSSDAEQFYDDIDVCQKAISSEKQNVEEIINVNYDDCKTLDEGHYQVPKFNPRPCSLSEHGELYDDIQLLTDFKT